TGLPNRALVLEHLQRGMDAARDGDQNLTVLFIDLDRFKIINDSLGHEACDAVLRTVAARLTELVSAGHTVGRLAGDEFVLVSTKLATVADAVALGEEIVMSLTRPF